MCELCHVRVMSQSLFKYFKRNDITPKLLLPEPTGSLSKTIPSSCIEVVNSVVEPLIEKASDECSSSAKDKGKSVRGAYEKFSADEKAVIGRRAAEYGVSATTRHFSKIYADRPLKESTVRGWKNQYNREVVRLRNSGKEVVVRELIDKKRGRPLLLGEEMDEQVRVYIRELRANGYPINTAIVIATGQGIIKDYDSNLLSENGGHLSLTKDWAKYLLKRMNFVKRRSSSTAKVSVDNFGQLKSQFIFDIQSIVEMEEIPGIKRQLSTFQYQAGQWPMKNLRE